MPRYIDADALKNELIECTPYAVDPVYRNTNSNIDMFTVMEMLDGQPTADVVPVVRGEWIVQERQSSPFGVDREWACSECEEIVGLGDDELHPLHDAGLNFCPNCGADMRGSEVTT